MSSSTGKRKRDDESLVPSEILLRGLSTVPRLMAFLDNTERLVLATACKTTKAAVEEFYQLDLAQILKDRVVDDSFQDRLCGLFASKGVSPDAIPQRCLWFGAHAIHLCLLQMFPQEGRRNPIGGNVSFSGDGSHVAVVGTMLGKYRPPLEEPQPPVMLYVWNLIDKTLQRMIEIPAVAYENCVNKVFWMEENIVICTMRRLMVVASDSGDVVRTHSHAIIHDAAPKDESSVVFHVHDYDLYSFSISSGETQKIGRLPFGCWSLHGIYQDRWLAVGLLGPRILDLRDELSVVCAVRGKFRGEQCFMNGSNLIYVCDDDSISSWELNESNGRLSKKWTSPIQKVNGYTSRGRGMITDNWFLEVNPLGQWKDEKTEDTPFISVQNIKTKRVQRLHLPHWRNCYDAPFHVQSNGKELFVSVTPDDGYKKDGDIYGAEIAVYLANRPF